MSMRQNELKPLQLDSGGGENIPLKKGKGWTGGGKGPETLKGSTRERVHWKKLIANICRRRQRSINFCKSKPVEREQSPVT